MSTPLALLAPGQRAVFDQAGIPDEMAGLGATAPFPGRLSEPVDGDPVLGWQGSGVGHGIMSTENAIPSRQRDPWNKGRLIGQKRPLKPKDVWTIRVRLQLEGR